MIALNGRGAVYGELWYDEAPRPGAGVDILVYRRHRSPSAAGGRPAPQVLTDLSASPAAIAEGFAATCRYEIRRADTRDGLDFEFLDKPADRVGEFRRFYDAFARQKSIRPADTAWLAAACRSRQLALSTVHRRGEALVWHAYVLSGATAGLLHSCSWFRSGDRELRALAGRANRWLHWQDMLRFRLLGYTRYDWGGLFPEEASPEEAGINAFKRSFGPCVEPAWDCSRPLSLRGHLWLRLRNTWRAGGRRGRADGDQQASATCRTTTT